MCRGGSPRDATEHLRRDASRSNLRAMRAIAITAFGTPEMLRETTLEDMLEETSVRA